MLLGSLTDCYHSLHAPQALGLLINGVRHATSGSEVSLWLRTGMREGLAGPKLVSAALDRLKDLQQRRPGKQQGGTGSTRGRKEAEPSLMAACELAMQQGIACLQQADLWLLVSMARTSYWLYYTVPSAQQAAITEAFLRLLAASEISSRQQGASVKVESPVQAQPALATEHHGSEDSSGASIVNGGSSSSKSRSNGSISSNKNSSSNGSVSRSSACSSSSRQGEAEQFIWATFSCANWHMTSAQRTALLHHVQRHPSDSPQHASNLLVALVRLESFEGPAAVAPFLVDGTLAGIIDRLMVHVGEMDAQQCQNSLLSIATLSYPLKPGQLAVLLEHLLAVIQASTRPADVIAKTFKGLALLHHANPGGYNRLLQLPAVRGLSEHFLGLAEDPAHRGEWLGEFDCMLRACAEMRYNPQVGEGGQRLLDVMLSQLPELAPQLSPFDATHALLGVGAYYGVPVRGELAQPLLPHRDHLAGMALRAQEKLPMFVAKGKNTWDVCTEQHVKDVVGAFAALSKE
ncbi:hypothetical protein N2152v2_007803 [Parachlorella kessleri]